MNAEAAELLGAHLLDWLAADPARLAGFLGATGIAPADLRASAGTPETLLAVLDHLLTDEAMLLAACRDLGLSPELPARARQALPGGEQIHWT